MVMEVAARRRALEPGGARLLIGDLSRPRGGSFDARFGIVGHSTHQNGRDADVYYPRRDARERPPRRVAQVDRRAAQALVDALLRAGAQVILVGPNTGLTGPAGRVRPWPNHDDHLHVRISAVRG